MGKNLADQAALVTGGSRGIGRAIARALAKEGARVAVHFHRGREAAEETVNSLVGPGHLLVRADLADPLAGQGMMEEAVRGLGRMDILVNNAGVYEYHPPLAASFEDWRAAWERTISTNLVGPAHLTFLAAQEMKKNGGGKIINITSRGAFRGEPKAPAYGAAKAGLNAFSQSMAQALAQEGIMVHAVAPGFVETDMAARELAGPLGDSIRAQSPLNRAARPEEVARVVVFLAGEGTEYLTGGIIDVNGASYLRT